MPVHTLDTPTTLLHTNKAIQLGTSSDPCTVLYGLSDIDSDKPWRSIRVVPNEEDLLVLEAFDKEHSNLNDIVKETDDNVKHITVKVHPTSLTKAYDVDKTKLSDINDALTKDVAVKVVVRTRRWKMNDQTGISLSARLIVIVADVGIDDILV